MTYTVTCRGILIGWATSLRNVDLLIEQDRHDNPERGYDEYSATETFNDEEEASNL